MATNKVKFKMSLKEVTFEFEGDYEQGRALQQGINQTMAGLANLQGRAIGLEDQNRKLIESRPVEPTIPARRRRKRRLTNGDGVDDAVESNNPDDAPVARNGDEPRRSTGVSPTARVIELR